MKTSIHAPTNLNWNGKTSIHSAKERRKRRGENGNDPTCSWKSPMRHFHKMKTSIHAPKKLNWNGKTSIHSAKERRKGTTRKQEHWHSLDKSCLETSMHVTWKINARENKNTDLKNHVLKTRTLTWNINARETPLSWKSCLDNHGHWHYLEKYRVLKKHNCFLDVNAWKPRVIKKISKSWCDKSKTNVDIMRKWGRRTIY